VIGVEHALQSSLSTHAAAVLFFQVRLHKQRHVLGATHDATGSLAAYRLESALTCNGAIALPLCPFRISDSVRLLDRRSRCVYERPVVANHSTAIDDMLTAAERVKARIPRHRLARHASRPTRAISSYGRLNGEVARHADMLTTILARMSARMSVSVS